MASPKIRVRLIKNVMKEIDSIIERNPNWTLSVIVDECAVLTDAEFERVLHAMQAEGLIGGTDLQETRDIRAQVGIKPAVKHPKNREPKKARSPWLVLQDLIADYANACRADEVKGGGDPDSIPVIEAELQLSSAKLDAHIAWMAREYE